MLILFSNGYDQIELSSQLYTGIISKQEDWGEEWWSFVLNTWV